MKEESIELGRLIEKATRCAAEQLFTETGEKFYYFSLITSGEADSPYVSAWSWEQLSSIPAVDRDLSKWSYADSPYCGYGSEFFEDVESAFSKRSEIWELPENEQAEEYNIRLDAMEIAMARLNESGLFGSSDSRFAIVINVEVMPPDETNTDRAIRLNPKEAIKDWLEEAAE